MEKGGWQKERNAETRTLEKSLEGVGATCGGGRKSEGGRGGTGLAAAAAAAVAEEEE